ncbi:MAG: hypothetical protein WCS92_00725 [Candidatus Babeliales bacterium]|jgi:hypothetical protein|nr:MAG: hypothetical protein US22_C0012G0004 [candidate division TM6 bacterium GW2011_GWF2_36_6]
MKSIFRKLLQAAVIVSLTLNFVSAYDLSKKTSASIFKGFGKYPYQFKLNPFNNQVDVILYGCLDENSNVKLVKSADDYANLVPVQFTMNFPDNGTKKKMTYHGYYADGTYTTKIADSTLRLFGMLPSEDYKKDFNDDFLMAEYESGMPIKMVFANLDQFKAVKSYLQSKFENPEVASESTDDVQSTDVNPVSDSNKPLLLIEIANGEAIEQSDLDFLNTYFEVADANDEVVQAFFNKTEKTISKLKDFNQVGKSFGDMWMELIDKDFDNGDAKKLTVRAVKVFAQAFTFVLMAKLSNDYLINPVYTRITNYLNANGGTALKESVSGVVEKKPATAN